MTDRFIHIRRNLELAFAVTVEPPLEVDFSKTWPTHKGARSYASMIGLLRELPVVDETEGGAA